MGEVFAMNKRENLLAMLKKQDYEEVPVDFSLCPLLVETYRRETGSPQDYWDYFGLPWRSVAGPAPRDANTGRFQRYYPNRLKDGTRVDQWGVAREPGSAEAMHMTHMRHPLANADSVAAIEDYPFPDFDGQDGSAQKASVEAIHAQGLAAVGQMQMTIWETAWAIRGMENLMVDMMTGDDIATRLLDRVTAIAKIRAALYVGAGANILFVGDDIGMQRTAMMSDELYTTWLKPRLREVIDAARTINPDVLIFYHSCGMVLPFIPHLIDVGVDVLNPVQPECMDFREVYETYGDRLSFCGTIGTQTTMPHGTPEEVRAAVRRNLDIADGGKGLFVTPTHLLEPDVPWLNVLAYVQACREYKHG